MLDNSGTVVGVALGEGCNIWMNYSGVTAHDPVQHQLQYHHFLLLYCAVYQAHHQIQHHYMVSKYYNLHQCNTSYSTNFIHHSTPPFTQHDADYSTTVLPHAIAPSLMPSGRPPRISLSLSISLCLQRSEERRVGKSVDLGGRRIIKKKIF